MRTCCESFESRVVDGFGLGTRGEALLVHRAQLPAGPHLFQLAGSEPAGTCLVRSRQRNVQEESARGTAGVVRDGAAASDSTPGVGSGGLSAE